MEKKTMASLMVDMGKKTMASLMVVVVIVASMIVAGLDAKAELNSLQPVYVFPGKGYKIIHDISLEKGAAIFRIHHEGYYYNIWLLNWVGTPIEHLCEPGYGQDVVRGVRIEEKGKYGLRIDGCGKWTITIEQQI